MTKTSPQLDWWVPMYTCSSHYLFVFLLHPYDSIIPPHSPTTLTGMDLCIWWDINIKPQKVQREYESNVENQPSNSVKALQLDHDGEYLSQPLNWEVWDGILDSLLLVHRNGMVCPKGWTTPLVTENQLIWNENGSNIFAPKCSIHQKDHTSLYLFVFFENDISFLAISNKGTSK